MKKNIYHIQMGFSVYIRDDDKPDEDTLTLRAVRALRDVINDANDSGRFNDSMGEFIETISRPQKYYSEKE